MLSAFSSKASISDGMGVHKCLRYGQLACFGRHYECWKVSKGFSNICSPPDDVYFSRTMQNHILQLLQQHGFSRRVRVLNWPACSPDLSPIENIWHNIKRKIRQRRPRTLQQLETYIRQEWDQIPTPKLQKLITSMPRCLQTVLKRRGDATPW